MKGSMKLLCYKLQVYHKRKKYNKHLILISANILSTTSTDFTWTAGMVVVEYITPHERVTLTHVLFSV